MRYPKNRKKRFYPTIDIAVRLDKWSIPEPNTGCWLWFGSQDRDGYGKLIRQRKHVRAHRASFEVHCGPIPVGMYVLHRCDMPACINPEHLFLGSNQDNMDDMMRKGRKCLRPTKGKTKLTPEQILAIRQDRRSLIEIAEEYKITSTYASRIRCKRVVWKQWPTL